MALDKFRNNLIQEDLEQKMLNKWKDEEIRIRDEILTSFCRFLKSEGFSINREELSAEAQYGTAIISIEVVDYRKVYKESLTDTLWYLYRIKYNKWNNTVQLNVATNVLNQPITESREGSSQYGYFNIFKKPEKLKEYIENFQPIKYDLSAQLENDRTQIGFFGKVFATVNNKNADKKRTNSIQEIVEAVLNDEFSLNGIW